MPELYPNEGGVAAPDVAASFSEVVRSGYGADSRDLGYLGLLEPFVPGEIETAEGPAVIYGCYPLNSDSDSDGGRGEFASI